MTCLALDKSCNRTSSSLRLLATRLLFTAVVAMIELKSRCGTGGAPPFSCLINFCSLPNPFKSSRKILGDKFRSDVEVDRCEEMEEGARSSWHANSRSFSRPSNALEDCIVTLAQEATSSSRWEPPTEMSHNLSSKQLWKAQRDLRASWTLTRALSNTVLFYLIYFLAGCCNFSVTKLPAAFYNSLLLSWSSVVDKEMLSV